MEPVGSPALASVKMDCLNLISVVMCVAIPSGGFAGFACAIRLPPVPAQRSPAIFRHQRGTAGAVGVEFAVAHHDSRRIVDPDLTVQRKRE